MSSAIRSLVLFVTLCVAAKCWAAPALRVCADPNDMPYSNQQQQGFENELAQIIASDLGMHVSYVWYPQRGRFFEKTLDAGVCDVVMSVPAGMEEAAITRPYYVSTYAFVSRRERHLHITSLDDPRLRTLRIGVHILGDEDDNVPPVQALIRRGMVRNLVGYSIFGHLDQTNPAANLIKAVADKEVDIAVVWGPLAGYFAQKSAVPLDVSPIAADRADPAMTYSIGIGVRPQDAQLRQTLDAELQRRKPEIRKLLASYGIPQVHPTSAVEGGN